MKLRIGCVVVGFSLFVLSLVAQTASSASTSSQVPPLIQFSSVATDEGGNSMSGVVTITFSLYAAQQGGDPLWTETQSNVQLDPTGHYSVQLGITKPNGVPTALFTSGEARWLGVQIAQQLQQPRVLLLSVPYALKAGDATTIGGLSPSAFVLAVPQSGAASVYPTESATSRSALPAVATDVTTTGDKAKYLPVFNGAATIVDSAVYQSVIGAGAKIGIGTITPAATLDVNGTVNAATGYNLAGSTFAFGSFTNQNAFFGFAGNSTMTGAGNIASGYQALLFNTTGYANTANGWGALANNTIGCCNTATGNEALTHNTTGNTNTASGSSALQANTTGFANTATGDGALFFNTGGYYNTATGSGALDANTGGYANTANGWEALFVNSAGNYNTAIGAETLLNLTSGSSNTALGASAGPDSGFPSLSNSTAIGANADVTASNSLVLGSINGTNGATADTYVGVGTTAPSAKFSVSGVESTINGFGSTIKLSNSAAGGGNFYFRAGATGTSTPAGGFSIANDNLYIMSMNSGGHIGIDTNTITNVLTIAQGAGAAISDGWTTYSSRRWKTNIQPLHNALGAVEQLRGVSYDLKDSGKHEIGVIAEEVGKVVPEVVSYEENGKDARGVDYSRLTALLIEATKEQQRQFRQEQAVLAKALRQIKRQQSQLRAQNAALRTLQSEVRETRESLRKVKAQVAASELTVVAAK
jgi:hypothetical protein